MKERNKKKGRENKKLRLRKKRKKSKNFKRIKSLLMRRFMTSRIKILLRLRRNKKNLTILKKKIRRCKSRLQN